MGPDYRNRTPTTSLSEKPQGIKGQSGMTTPVVFSKCEYDLHTLRAAVRETLERIGGLRIGR